MHRPVIPGVILGPRQALHRPAVLAAKPVLTPDPRVMDFCVTGKKTPDIISLLGLLIIYTYFMRLCLFIVCRTHGHS